MTDESGQLLDEVLKHHVAILGKTGSGDEWPAYKRDPARILRWQRCAQCGRLFPIVKKFPDARFCGRRCGLAATLPEGHNARVSRASAKRRGDSQRDRGAGKTYRKRDGRHEHRVVAELKLGRPLNRGEVVHHIDGRKRNNAPENLDVLESQGIHAKCHDSLAGVRWRKPGTLLTLGGRSQNIAAWAREVGLAPSTLRYRISEGWPVEYALGRGGRRS